jgi:hypothetical protein
MALNRNNFTFTFVSIRNLTKFHALRNLLLNTSVAIKRQNLVVWSFRTKGKLRGHYTLVH